VSHSPTQQLASLGVSIWLDDLSKDRLTSGSLADLIAHHNVVGVTSNPTIFAGSVAGSDSYAPDIQAMKREGVTAEEAVFRIMISDVQGACDLLRPVYDSTGGVDGRVSLEVSPLLARDSEGTVAQALELWAAVDRKNLMVKIPATREGLPAITRVLAEGISVNVTLIFSIERYGQVIDAYFAGIELAQKAGHDISSIHSVASFFVSRVDTAVDAELDALGSMEARTLRSSAAIANARLAYQLFQQRHASKQALVLAAAGMNPQRPLWASTGVKDPALPPALYVTELAGDQTVNTMPEKTLRAASDFSGVVGDRVTSEYAHAEGVMAGLKALGVSVAAVTDELERDGVAKFVQSWQELLDTVQTAMDHSE
jgi:transaldolase